MACSLLALILSAFLLCFLWGATRFMLLGRWNSRQLVRVEHLPVIELV